MTKITSAALFFLAAGIFTSVTILSAYQILFAIPLAYYIYLALKNKDFELPKSAWFLLAFTVVALLSLIINYDLIPKPSKNFGRLKYFIFGVGGIYVYKVWLDEVTNRAKKIILNIFYLTILISASYAIYTYAISEISRGSGLTETMRYGYGTSMVLLILLSSVLNNKHFGDWFNFKTASFFFVIGFFGMYFTYTRGALLGFLCGLPFVLYYFKPKLGLTLGSGALFLIMILGGFYLFGSGNYNSRFLVSKNNNSDKIRRSQWQAAIIATKEKPLLGWGLSNFHSQLKRIKQENDLDAKHYNDAHAHNLFLEVSSGTGIIGLSLFLAWLISWAYECFKAKGIIRSLIFPFGVGFVVSSQFEVTFDANNASLIFTIYAISSALQKKSSANAV